MTDEDMDEIDHARTCDWCGTGHDHTAHADCPTTPADYAICH